MQELQEQIPVIYMDVVYAGIAGANSWQHILPTQNSDEFLSLNRPAIVWLRYFWHSF